MKLAVITPFHKTPAAWLQQCLASVAQQSVPCTHFLVCDGDEPKDVAIAPTVQVIRLPQAHADVGNTPRAIGSASAISQGFDAIAYLDSDNWYERDHLRHLWEAHQRTGASICSSGRNLYDLNGQLLGRCPEVDGKNFVDTDCLFLTRKAFGFVAAWYLMQRSQVEIGDRVVWNAIKSGNCKRVHLDMATVNYRTRYRAHYLHFGKEPPAGAKEITVRAGPAKSVANHVGRLSRAGRTGQETRSTGRGVSLCMIVKNEEAHLETCLRSVADLVQEMIVVDTGSADRTTEIARQCGAKVFDFPWQDSFAAARNESLRHAAGPWILWLDADEFFDDEQRQRLKALLGRLQDNNHVYMMTQWSLPEQEKGSALIVDQARLFRKQPGVAWRYRVHEQILPALQEQGARIVSTGIVLKHRGYQNAALRKDKLLRNLRLLLLDHEERPDEPLTQFDFGSTYTDLGEFDKAVPLLLRCLEKVPPRASFIGKTFLLLSQIHRRQGQLDVAMKYCLDGKAKLPQDVELWFEEGLLCEALKDMVGAQKCFEAILAMPARPSYVGVAAGLRGQLARHHLAKAMRMQGQPPAAGSLSL